MLSMASSGSNFLGSAVQFSTADTVIRIRGRFDAFLVSYTSAGDGFQGAVGIGLATLAAVTAGAASVPTPITEQSFDGWLWHSYFGVHGALAAGSTSTGDTHAFSLEIDSKVMRKVGDEVAIYAILEVVEIGTAVANFFLDSRMLVKLG